MPRGAGVVAGGSPPSARRPSRRSAVTFTNVEFRNDGAGGREHLQRILRRQVGPRLRVLVRRGVVGSGSRPCVARRALYSSHLPDGVREAALGERGVVLRQVQPDRAFAPAGGPA